MARAMRRATPPDASESLLVRPLFPVGLLACGYFALAAFFALILRYDFMRSDVSWYWKNSLSWETPFDTLHVPGYPLTIALVRGVTLGMLPPVPLMMGINLAAFLLCGLTLHRILRAAGVSGEMSAIGVLLFGLWPFVGLVYAVDPIADIPGMLFFLLGLSALQRLRLSVGALFLGISVVVQKAMWPFVGLTMLADFLWRKEYISRRNLQLVALAGFPLAGLWTLGAVHYHSLAWIFLGSTEMLIVPRSSWMLLNGLLGTILAGGTIAMMKGVSLLSLAALSVFAVYTGFSARSGRDRVRHFYGLAVSCATLVLFVMLNQYEIWAAVRFSRLLVIPLIPWAFGTLQARGQSLAPGRLRIVIVVMVALFGTQLAYAWYMARVFFA
jgi:hypothetical protein